jgi:hypothetical protein
MLGRILLSGLAAVGILITPLSGCGSRAATLNTVAVESAIAGSILEQHHLHVRVECPSRVQRRTGVAFVCTARLPVGAYPVVVIEIDGSGRVRYENRSPLVALDVARVQDAIAGSILSQRHLRSAVTCPAEVIQRAGVRFTCTATVAGRGYLFEVAELNGSGQVRYVGRR